MNDERYSRVSDPDRYREVVMAADVAFQRLEDEFDVVRLEGQDVDPTLVTLSGHGRLIRLVPRVGDGAPITAWLEEGFGDDGLRYGLFLRLGSWYVAPLPHCGCDACFEDGYETVQHVVHELEFLLRAVTEGRYSEVSQDDDTVLVRMETDTETRATSFEKAAATDIERPVAGWGPWVRRRP